MQNAEKKPKVSTVTNEKFKFQNRPKGGFILPEITS